MKETIEHFFEKMLFFFPEQEEEYKNHIKKFSKRLDTVIIEDIFMPEIIKLLENNDELVLLNKVFRYFEKVSSNADKNLLNVFSITIMEILGNDPDLLNIAKQYMGPKTIKLQHEADKDLGRVF